MSPSSQRTRVAVLISGRGSNLKALLDAANQQDYPAEIVGVISNRADAAGLENAQAAGIPTQVITKKSAGSAQQADIAMTEQLESWKVEIVCLAGFMRILSSEFAQHWSNRLINIHPSLLPKFKGLDTHARAIEAGEVVHGCTVHFVVPELDAGPIIAQSKVDVLSSDTPESLAKRVLGEEHKLYPEALRRLIEQRNSI